jgi:hypothetical protein
MQSRGERIALDQPLAGPLAGRADPPFEHEEVRVPNHQHLRLVTHSRLSRPESRRETPEAVNVRPARVDSVDDALGARVSHERL